MPRLEGGGSSTPAEVWTARSDRHAALILTGYPRSCVLTATAIAATFGIACPTLAFSAFPTDLVEGFLWGRTFERGYHKHPPLQAWLLGALERVVADSGRWLAFVLAQICVIATVIPVWLLSRSIAGKEIGALSALLTLAGIHFYSSPTHTLTPDTLSLPFWPMVILFYWRAVGERSDRAWFGLALAAAGFFYAKYIGLLLIAILVVLTLATREGRAALSRPAPWLAAALALLLCLPHLWWLWETSGSPVAYLVTRAIPAASGNHVVAPLRFLANQMLNHLGLALLLAILFTRIPFRPTAETTLTSPPVTGFTRIFLLTITVAPAVCVVAANVATGASFSSAWGSPFYAFSALGALLLLSGCEKRLRNLSTVLALVPLVIAGQHLIGSFALYWENRALPVTYPARSVAVELTRRFRETSGRPLRLVVGERWHAGNVAFYSPDRPLLLFDGQPAISPGLDQGSPEHDHALLVWEARLGDAMPGIVGGAFAGIPAQGMVEEPWLNARGTPKLRLRFAIVQPKNEPEDPTDIPVAIRTDPDPATESAVATSLRSPK